MARSLRGVATFRTALGAVIGLALMVSLATVVFACTYIPHLYAVSPQSGVPGSDLTLTGNTAAVGHPVTLRWNGLHGRVLATVTPDAKGDFQATVKVPDVAPGQYFIAADSGGGIARVGFQVTGTGSAAGAPLSPVVAPEAAGAASTTVVDGVPTASSWLTSALIPGLLLFAVGALGIVGGFGFVLARRRRVPTRAS